MSTQDALPLTYTITLPQATAWDSKRAYQFTEQLLSAFQALVFRIVASPERIDWQIVDVNGHPSGVMENAIHATYPDAFIRVVSFGESDELALPVYRYILKYQYSIPLFVAPIQSVTDFGTGPDPLSLLVQAMSDLCAGERVMFTLVVDGLATEAYKAGQKLVERPIYTGSIASLLFPVKIDRYVSELQHILVAKLQQRLYHASVFIQIDTPDRARLPTLLTIDNHMVSFDRPQFNGLHWIDEGECIEVTDLQTDWQESALGLYTTLTGNQSLSRPMLKLRQAINLTLEARELASLWHLPHQDFASPLIIWTHAQVRLPARLVGQREGVCLGVNQVAGRTEPVYLSDRSGHMSIVGKAGVGKSTLLHQCIHQDIAAGRGVAVIDPHGALIRDILRVSIPPEREQDVILLDLSNEDYPPPMNLLAVPKGTDPATAAGRLMAVLNTVYDEFKDTPTVADTLWATLTTLLYEQNPTVRDVSRLLTDPAYRLKLVERIDNAAVQEFWDRFEIMSKGQQEQLIRPVLWRMRAFYANSTLYPVMCHPQVLDLPTLIAQNKILLISLKADETRVPLREQQLLGSALMSQIQQAVMGRSAGSPPYYLYIDEVQHFVTTTLDTVLSEARKFGLSLTLANQYLKQLAGNTLDALMGNIGVMVVFQCGLEDAKALAPYLSPGFDAQTLINLNKYEAGVKLRFRDETQPAFSLTTLSPFTASDEKAALEREKVIRTRSIERYTPQSRAQVMAWLKARYPAANRASNATNGQVVDFEPLS